MRSRTTWLRSVLVTVTLAPGTPEPLESKTVPEIFPEASCAGARDAMTKANSKPEPIFFIVK
jgi:hypothetical protein